MPYFARIALWASLAALSGAAPALACLTCGKVDAGGSLTMLDGFGSADDVQIDVETGFNFRRAQTSGNHVLEAPGTGSFGSGPGVPGLVGQVRLKGTPGRLVYVEVPHEIVLVNVSGDRIMVHGIESDLPHPAKLDADGRLEFSFSGTLSVPALPASGDYVADIAISASYE